MANELVTRCYNNDSDSDGIVKIFGITSENNNSNLLLMIHLSNGYSLGILGQGDKFFVSIIDDLTRDNVDYTIYESMFLDCDIKDKLRENSSGLINVTATELLKILWWCMRKRIPLPVDYVITPLSVMKK